MAGPFVDPLPAGRTSAGGTPGSAGVGWGLVDVISLAVSTPTAGNGAATLNFPPVNVGERWQLQHAVAACSVSSPQPRLRLYVNDISDQRNLRAGTGAAAFDEADWPLGLWLFEADTLLAAFTGAAAGATVSLRIQYQLWRRAS